MTYLTKPTRDFAKSWEEAIQEFEADNQGGFWNVPEKPASIEEYIERTESHSQGKNIPESWVPSDTYWLIDNHQFVGHVNVRHTLNARLKKRGGHIGYTIRPSARNKGYGNKILELALPKAKAVGLQKVLITCDDSNIASQKIIEKNNGQLQDTIEFNGEKIRRYWIHL